MVSAEQLIAKIQKNAGGPWQRQRSNGVLMGSADTMVTGIVATFTPTLEVLRKTVDSGKNVVICRDAPSQSQANAFRCSGEMLQPLRKNAEVPIQFIPSGDPFWMPA